LVLASVELKGIVEISFSSSLTTRGLSTSLGFVASVALAGLAVLVEAAEELAFEEVVLLLLPTASSPSSSSS